MISFSTKFMWNGAPGGRFKRRKPIAHAALDSAIIKDVNPLVPFRTGMLASSVFRSGAQVGTIVYDTPYARAVYYRVGGSFNRAFHEMAGPKWVERGKALWLPKWIELVEKILKGR